MFKILKALGILSISINAFSVERNSELINKVMNLKDKTDRPYLFEVIISTKIEKDIPADSVKVLGLDVQYELLMRFLTPKEKSNFKNYTLIITKDTFPVFKKKFQPVKSPKDFLVLQEKVRLNKEGKYQVSFYYNEILEEAFEVNVQKEEEKFPMVENLLGIEKARLLEGKAYGGIYTDAIFNASAIKSNDFEYIDIVPLLEKSCVGNFKIAKKEIRSDDIESLKDISLKTIQENFDKGIAPSKENYFDGDAILRLNIQRNNGFGRNLNEELMYSTSISMYDIKNNIAKGENFGSTDFSIGEFPFTKYVNVNKVALGMIYKYEHTGKGGGTIGNDGIDQAFKVYKKDNEYYMQIKSKTLRQWTHMPIAKKVDYEFNCKFQQEDPILKKQNEESDKFKNQFKK